jgi:DNA-binding PadR family transcriptional regulator
MTQPATDPRRFLPLSPQQFHILLALEGGDRHGYGIILEVARRTDQALRMGTGTLYTAMARLVTLDLAADTGREDERRRYYRLTPLGRRVLVAETARLEALVRDAHRQGVRGPAPARTRS